MDTCRDYSLVRSFARLAFLYASRNADACVGTEQRKLSKSPDADRNAAFDCALPNVGSSWTPSMNGLTILGRIDDLNVVASDPERIGSFLRRSVRRSELP